jgi:RNA polymerase sigma-70 factor (ECF subfamily)
MQTDLASDEIVAPDSVEEKVSAAPATIDLDSLYRQYHHHMLRFVQRYVRNPEDAEDVVQSAFLEAFRCADRFSGLSKPSTWLFGIALNLARNHVRRSCTDPIEFLDEALLDQIVDMQADPANLVDLRELVNKVEAVLGNLPPHIRATFEAVLDGESTYEQAAEQLDIPIGTVRSRVSRVRAAIRSEFT